MWSMTEDRDDIGVQTQSSQPNCDRSYIEHHDTTKHESVGYDELHNTFAHYAFRPQHLIFDWVDEQNNVQDWELKQSEGRAGPANTVENLLDDDSRYDVEFAETDEGLALEARTCSTYDEGYTIAVRNVPMLEIYHDTGTCSLADTSAEDVEILLNGGDPMPSIRESMRRSFDTLKQASQSLRKQNLSDYQYHTLVRSCCPAPRTHARRYQAISVGCSRAHRIDPPTGRAPRLPHKRHPCRTLLTHRPLRSQSR